MSLIESRDVLIVDDDDAIRNLLRAAVLRVGLTCDTAVDGIDALEHLRAMRYQVVLTDLMMPRLDGVGFVQALAALDQTLNGRPVVLIMTAFPEGSRLSDVADLVHVVIRKPFEVLELAELVRGCVKKRPQEEGPARTVQLAEEVIWV